MLARIPTSTLSTVIVLDQPWDVSISVQMGPSDGHVPCPEGKARADDADVGRRVGILRREGEAQDDLAACPGRL